jgi:F-type H+-transporting ATPase subunit beta
MTPTATAEQGAAEVKAGAVGRISRVTGPVVDIEFPHDAIPGIVGGADALSGAK